MFLRRHPFKKKSKRTSLTIYDDYAGNGIVNASHISSGTLDFYSRQQSGGNYCLCWSDVGQYDGIGFDFRPDVDLSLLKDHDFQLKFKVKSTASATKFDIRFVDTKAGIADRPWRMGVTVDNAMAGFDGQWQEVSIPLSALAEKGAWDEAWYEPKGLFDWKNIDRLEIVPEAQSLTGLSYCFDDIAIVGDDIPEEVVTGIDENNFGRSVVYPNPSSQGFTIQHHSLKDVSDIRVYNQLGIVVKVLDVANYWDGTADNGLRVSPGLYMIVIGNGDVHRVVVR